MDDDNIGGQSLVAGVSWESAGRGEGSFEVPGAHPEGLISEQGALNLSSHRGTLCLELWLLITARGTWVPIKIQCWFWFLSGVRQLGVTPRLS